MKPKLAIALLLLVLLPVTLFAWLGFRLAKAERERVDAGFEELAEGQLSETVNALSLRMAGLEDGLRMQLEAASIENDAEKWRELARTAPLVRGAFVQDSKGLMSYPLGDELTAAERSFLQRTDAVWQSGALMGVCAVELETIPNRSLQKIGKGAAKVTADTGWHTWFYNQGACFLFWRRDRNGGGVSGVDVNRSALLSELIAALPDSNQSASAYVALVDASGKTLYGWGDPTGAESESLLATKPLAAPLGMWRLEMRSSVAKGAEAGLAGATFSNIAGWLVAAAALVGGLGFYLYRGHQSELLEAGQRVSFVNQVSHELKTPLTNIRMYAELLERRIPDDDKDAEGWLKVVVDESRRLSRLISNVLTFSRHGEGKLDLHPRSVAPDEVIDGVLIAFGPSLRSEGIEVRFEGGASEEVRIDPDVLEQVLGNLVSNVEKYAAKGGGLWISSEIQNEVLRVRVEDAGEGISQRDKDRIFQAFTRLGDGELTEGSSGTGIGLSIARDLARLHGGDLQIVSPQFSKGAAFEARFALMS